MSDNLPAPAIIDYYTDVLCVWAWIAQPRLNALQQQWGEQIEVRHRYVDIFGDAHTKIAQRWGKVDGFEKFGSHIIESASPYDDTPVNPNLWKRTKPRSSMPAHLLLKAVTLVCGAEATQPMALKIRQAFFVEARDISQIEFLLEMAAELKLNTQELGNCLKDGRAMACLSADQRGAVELGVKGSPTWVLNEGRQVLYGNVGYRILNANIEELLKRPAAEASWC